MDVPNKLVTIVVYAAIGAVYGSAGYVSNVIDGDATLKKEKLLKTICVGLIAGCVVAINDETIDESAIDAAMVIAVPIVDKFDNAIRS